MSKIPAFQFYPADWRKDIAVQSLSFHDRGVWFEILCLMHESEERGRLVLNGKPMSEEILARLLGLDKQTLITTLTRLLDLGVATRDEQGALVNRRMLRDERLRRLRAEAGKKGGQTQNPQTLYLQEDAILLKQNAKQNASKMPSKTQAKRKQNAKQNAPPSSSSSSSTSVNNSPSYSDGESDTTAVGKPGRGSRIPEDFSLSEEMREWAIRKCPAIDPELETEKFVNYWRAKTGRDATKLDWLATWRNWILNAKPTKEVFNGHTRPTATDRLYQQTAILERYPEDNA